VNLIKELTEAISISTVNDMFFVGYLTWFECFVV